MSSLADHLLTGSASFLRKPLPSLPRLADDPDVASLLSRRRPALRGRHTPRLWSVWLVAPLALALVAAVSFGLYHGVYALLENAARHREPLKPVSVNDVIRTTVTVLTLVGAVLAGIYAYRKQLLSEGDAHRADADQLATRYTTAAEQLGHDQAAVRLAGVYALARLADDWLEQSQVCVDVLCAYLRMPYQPDPARDGHKEGEREVRLTIIRVIRDHLQWKADRSWRLLDFDFTGAVFDGGDFSGALFGPGKVTFRGTRFSGGRVTFRGASFVLVDVGCFRGAEFRDGTVDFTGVRCRREPSWRPAPTGDDSVCGVDLGDALFTGATLYFNRVQSQGPSYGLVSGGGDVEINLARAQLRDGTLDLRRAQVGGGSINFWGATVAGGSIDLRGARITGGRISFSDARFRAGVLDLDGARFEGGIVDFGDTDFSGAALNFRESTFDGGVISFHNATFRAGTVDFRNAALTSGEGAQFSQVQFSGTVFDWGPFTPLAGAQ